MLNQELVGVSLYSAVSLIRAFFLRRLSLRGMFRLFYATRIAVPRMTFRKVQSKTGG